MDYNEEDLEFPCDLDDMLIRPEYDPDEAIKPCGTGNPITGNMPCDDTGVCPLGLNIGDC